MHLVNVDRKLEHRGGHISKLVQRESCLQQLGCCIHFPIGLWKITWNVNWQLLQSSCATVLIHLPQCDIIKVCTYTYYIGRFSLLRSRVHGATLVYVLELLLTWNTVQRIPQKTNKITVISVTKKMLCRPDNSILMTILVKFRNWKHDWLTQQYTCVC